MTPIGIIIVLLVLPFLWAMVKKPTSANGAVAARTPRPSVTYNVGAAIEGITWLAGLVSGAVAAYVTHDLVYKCRFSHLRPPVFAVTPTTPLWVFGGLFGGLGISVLGSGVIARWLLGKERNNEYVAITELRSRLRIALAKRVLSAIMVCGGVLLVLPSDSFMAVSRDGITFKSWSGSPARHYSPTQIEHIEMIPYHVSVSDYLGGGAAGKRKYEFSITFTDGVKWRSQTTDARAAETERQAIEYLAKTAALPIEGQ
jgi:hypothetical protein